MKQGWPGNWEHLLPCGSTKQSTDHKADPISYLKFRNKTVNFDISKAPAQWPKRRPQDLQPLPNENPSSAPALHGAPVGDWVLIGSPRHLERALGTPSENLQQGRCLRRVGEGEVRTFYNREESIPQISCFCISSGKLLHPPLGFV